MTKEFKIETASEEVINSYLKLVAFSENMLQEVGSTEMVGICLSNLLAEMMLDCGLDVDYGARYFSTVLNEHYRRKQVTH